ncbi:hypothetical protein BDZ94DRAFT_1322377 [Collybia nuda]|uniref:Uncharacterized protein n=1 Tax=Collybia nuda TaxID=64659 RepID=A0A9P5Y5N7_9AGAR|nr:hypothetical protein BDZ94DRAFT_1322377 [Collybia nuda]
MRLSLKVFLSAVAIPCVVSTSIPVVGDYADLYAACEAFGPDAYAAVRYEHGPPKIFKFGVCQATRDPEQGVAKSGAICRAGSCYGYS